jgi:DNA-binding GntR family transcriptional regulator
VRDIVAAGDPARAVEAFENHLVGAYDRLVAARTGTA